MSKVVMRLEDIKGGCISSDGGYIIFPPDDDWCGIKTDRCENMVVEGFFIITPKSKFRYRMIQKILGLIGWKTLLFGGKMNE